jgi:hypothetical protein
VIIHIEVAIKNNNLDSAGKKARRKAGLLIPITTTDCYLDESPIVCPDLPLCKDLIAQAVCKAESVSWSHVRLYNSCSAQTRQTNGIWVMFARGDPEFNQTG